MFRLCACINDFISGLPTPLLYATSSFNKQVSGCGLLYAYIDVVPKTFGALAKVEHHVSSVIRALLVGE